MFNLDNKIAIVTGSTKGIGRAIARQMILAGAGVVISSRKAEVCHQVAEELAVGGGNTLAIPCNVSKPEERESLVQSTLAQWGKVDILVCNAAVNPYHGAFLDIPEDAYRKTLDVNIGAIMALSKLIVPGMQERKDGVIIILSSIAALRGSDTLGTYALTKAADMQLARNLAVAYGADNIRVNCIAPGLVKTDFAKALWEHPERQAKALASYPLQRLGEPEDIAGAAVFLASRAGAWMTGQTLIIDGGWSVKGIE